MYNGLCNSVRHLSASVSKLSLDGPLFPRQTVMTFSTVTFIVSTVDLLRPSGFVIKILQFRYLLIGYFLLVVVILSICQCVTRRATSGCSLLNNCNVIIVPPRGVISRCDLEVWSCNVIAFVRRDQLNEKFLELCLTICSSLLPILNDFYSVTRCS